MSDAVDGDFDQDFSIYAPLEANPRLPVQRVHAFRRTGNVWINGGMIHTPIADDFPLLRRLLTNMATDSGTPVVLHIFPLRRGSKGTQIVFEPDGTHTNG